MAVFILCSQFMSSKRVRCMTHEKWVIEMIHLEKPSSFSSSENKLNVRWFCISIHKNFESQFTSQIFEYNFADVCFFLAEDNQTVQTALTDGQFSSYCDRCLVDFFRCAVRHFDDLAKIFEWIFFSEIFHNYQCGCNRLMFLQLIVVLSIELDTGTQACPRVREALIPSRRLTVLISSSCVIFRWSIFWIKPCLLWPSL